MWPVIIIEREIVVDPLSPLGNRSVMDGINVLIFHGSQQAFSKYVVHTASPSIHAVVVSFPLCLASTQYCITPKPDETMLLHRPIFTAMRKNLSVSFYPWEVIQEKVICADKDTNKKGKEKHGEERKNGQAGGR